MGLYSGGGGGYYRLLRLIIIFGFPLTRDRLSFLKWGYNSETPVLPPFNKNTAYVSTLSVMLGKGDQAKVLWSSTLLVFDSWWTTEISFCLVINWVTVACVARPFDYDCKWMEQRHVKSRTTINLIHINGQPRSQGFSLLKREKPWERGW